MAWNEAEDEENTEVNLAEDRLCHSPEDMEIRARMESFMQTRLKWSHRELHDALLYAGLDTPTRPSMVNYFSTLHMQFGDSKVGFLPQALPSHTKSRIQDILRCLSRTGVTFGFFNLGFKPLGPPEDLGLLCIRCLENSGDPLGGLGRSPGRIP